MPCTNTNDRTMAALESLPIAPAQHAINEEVIQTLASLTRDLRFGSLEIVFHEGRITHIERREKLRVTKHTDTRSC